MHNYRPALGPYGGHIDIFKDRVASFSHLKVGNNHSRFCAYQDALLPPRTLFHRSVEFVCALGQNIPILAPGYLIDVRA